MSKIGKARNKIKADVRLENRGGQMVLLKDFSKRSFFIRFFFGRFTLCQEAKAYTRLESVAGIPRCFGFESKDVLALEYIPSRPLSHFKPGELEGDVFDKIDAILAEVHGRGVAIVDIKRSDILITEDKMVSIVDFALALTATNPARVNFLTRFFMQLDRHAAARIRARYLKGAKPVPRGILAVLYRTGRIFKLFRKKIKSKDSK